MYFSAEIQGEILVHLKDLCKILNVRQTHYDLYRPLKIYAVFTALYQPSIWMNQAQNEKYNFEAVNTVFR